MRNSPPQLNLKQAKFVDEYILLKNATQAAIRAGYSPTTAQWSGPLLLRKPHVSEAVRAKQEALAAKYNVTQEKLIGEFAKIAFSNMGDYMRVGPDGDPVLDFSNLTPEEASAISEITTERYMEGNGEDARELKRVKFKLHDKLSALVSLGKHLGMFNEKVDVNVTVTHKLASRLDDAFKTIEGTAREVPKQQSIAQRLAEADESNLPA